MLTRRKPLTYRPVRELHRVLSVVTLDAVLERDGHACVRCGTLLTGTRGLDWALHHRRPKAMGGSFLRDTNMPQNLISVCGPDNTHGCHGFIHSRPSESGPAGWLLSNTRSEEPLYLPLLVEHSSRWVYLTEDGRYADAPPERAV